MLFTVFLFPRNLLFDDIFSPSKCPVTPVKMNVNEFVIGTASDKSEIERL